MTTPPSQLQVVQKRSWLTATGWVLFGLVATVGGAVLLTKLIFDANPPGNSDSTALAVFLTAPLGAVAGAVLATVIGFGIEQKSPSPDGQKSRTALTIYGCLGPLLPVVAAGIVFFVSLRVI